MTIIAHHQITDLEHIEAPLDWQLQGLQFTRSGYGRRIPTQHMVKLPGGKRWRRVYCCIFSNSGTCYVPTKQGDWITID